MFETPIDTVCERPSIAEVVVRTIRDETFLALPHPAVLDYFRAKGADYDRWIGGMRKLQRRLTGG